MDQQLLDRLAIRDLVENWAVWRDAGDWERFATVWHEEGWMSATWFQGPARDFMRVSQEGFAKGVRILHFLGGTSIDLSGERAIAHFAPLADHLVAVEPDAGLIDSGDGDEYRHLFDVHRVDAAA